MADRKRGEGLPVPVLRPEASAIKALAQGMADERQQKLALACIGQKISLMEEPSFHPENAQLTAFNEGRRSVGLSIRRIIGADINDFPEVDHGR